MKHYVLFLRESKIGRNMFVPTHFIKSAKEPDEVPKISNIAKTLTDATKDLEQDGYTNANMSFAKFLDIDDSMKYAHSTLSGIIEMRESEQIFPLSLIEFILNDCGALSVYFFDQEGIGQRHLQFTMTIS